ncbi:hypothetical protein PGTUg99_022293 [Puccinia graminis f. sp. tritici]|uniref:Uncharacterized protein n=1 Tax=Puccinia graminis f. sp. tritici TaxID=56615 RepID=A0A5B0SMA0_PUCGR|nr:hypothetical protein PGTUg99_022293 [Puccinia graminis f. sp. tritici]
MPEAPEAFPGKRVACLNRKLTNGRHFKTTYLTDNDIAVTGSSISAQEISRTGAGAVPTVVIGHMSEASSPTAKVPKEKAWAGETDIRSGTDSREPITNIGISWVTKSPTLTTRLSSPAGSNSDSEPINMIWKHLISKAEANQSSGTSSVVNAETEDKEFHRILDDVFPPASKAPGDEHQNEDEYHGSEAFSREPIM